MKSVLYVAASIVALSTVSSQAQTNPNVSDAGTVEQNDGRLNEIIVTAQRRSQALEKVPASVQVLTGAELSAFRQTDLRSVSASVPNLVLTSSPSGAVSANIRGIGTTTSNSGFEQTVALYVDGVYQPRPHSYTGSMFDIDRIEVVKGTQGTLFGKNASVGAIGLYSRDPKAEFGGQISAAYDFTLKGPRLEGGVNLPVSDQLRVRVAGLFADETKGWIKDVTKNKKFPTNTEYGIRAKAEFDLTDNLTINAKAEYNKLKRTGTLFAQIPGNVVGGGIPIKNAVQISGTTLLPENDNYSGFDRRSNTETLGATWRVNDRHTITALSAWTRLHMHSYLDFTLNGSPPDVSLAYEERFRQFTQELRFASDESQPFEYMAGLFYLNQTLSYATDTRGLNRFNVLDTDLNTYSAFVQGKYKFGNGFSLTAGARITKEKKSGILTAIKAAGTGITAGKTNNTDIDWNAIGEYEFSVSSKVYASISRGHKGPGFLNSTPGGAITVPQLIYKSERATNYEIGAKSRFLDGRARGSIALYNLDVKDYQGSTFDPNIPPAGAFITSNVDVRSRGVEAELQLQVTPSLRMNFNGAYNDGILKATGAQNISAPRWSSTANFAFTPRLSERLEGLVSGQLNYVSKFPNQFDLQPGNFNPSHANLDLRIGVKDEQTGMQLALIGRNVTNKRYIDFSSGYPFAATNAVFMDQIAKPRTIAVEIQLPIAAR